MRKIVVQNREYEFPYPIKKKVEIPEYIIILLDIPPGTILNETVFVINKQKKKLWQIDKAIVDRHKLIEDAPFVDADFNVDGNVVLWNWDGWKVILTPETGEELSYEFTK